MFRFRRLQAASTARTHPFAAYLAAVIFPAAGAPDSFR
jgi:hypothetical protein